MRADLLFLAATALTWIGWGCALRVAYLAILQFLAKRTVIDRLVTPAVVAAIALTLAFTFRVPSGRPDPAGIDLPLVWVQLSYQAFGLVASLLAAILLWVKAFMAIDDTKRKKSGVSGLIWLVLSGLFAWYYRETGGEVVVFRGVVGLTVERLVVLVVISVAGLLAMAWSAKFASRKRAVKGFVTHVTLIAGTVVFGLPFAWLLITSFKEDKDISTTQGMVWVPRVQQTVPYFDPKKPYFETRFRDATVRGSIQEALSGGAVLLEIERPYNLRGRHIEVDRSSLTEIPRMAKVVAFDLDGQRTQGFVVEELENSDRVINVQSPPSSAGKVVQVPFAETEPVRKIGLRTENYGEMLEWLPAESKNGLLFLRNTLVLVVMSVIGTLLSSILVGYGFSRLRFPGRETLFGVLLATMMLPGAVTMLPTFLLFRNFGWIDTLYPIWVPTFFAGAFNVFLLRQFFRTIPMELEDAAKIDGCSYMRTLFQVMVPQIKPVLATIAVWTFMGAWNNFMGPLIYVSTPENMPIAYALQMFQTERGTEFALMMSFATLATIPTVLLFFFAQRYFIEGVQLSGLGGR